MKRPITLLLALLLTSGLFIFSGCGEEPLLSAPSIVSEIESTESVESSEAEPAPSGISQSVLIESAEPQNSVVSDVISAAETSSESISEQPEASSISHVHTFAGDCDAVCEACGHERIIAHVYTSDCDNDCDTCGLLREVPPHVFKNDCDAICDVKNCSYVRIPTHYLTEATCGAPVTCSKCRITFGTALGHFWSQNKCLVQDYCTRCGTEGYVYHSFVGESCTRCNAPTSSVPKTLPR